MSTTAEVSQLVSSRQRRPAGMYIGQGATYLLLLVLALIFMLPMVWLISTSLKPEKDVFTIPPQFIPKVILAENYLYAVTRFPFWQSFRNTVVIVIGSMAGHLITVSFTAYIFARLRFPGRGVLFALVLATMMIPYHVYLIPQYLFFRQLGWLNSAKPLIIPQLLGLSPFFIFLLRQFFLSIPKEYDDAARIDGCGYLDIYWRIIIPLSLPALGSVAIFSFMGTWNDFLAPLIYLNEPSKQTLALAIRTYEGFRGYVGGTGVSWGVLMAIAVLIALPPVLVFFLTQRYFIQGVVISGVKG